MSRPKFTIVTASFNSVGTIRDTIESILSQDCKDWEHWVIDGGSTDGTLELLKQYPHIKYISERDSGLYEAMNKGVARAAGEILLMLNSDDCLTPGALTAIAHGFAKNPDWDAAFADIIFVDNQGGEIYRREEAQYDYHILRFSGVCYVIHQTLYVKKSLYDRIGAYRFRDFVIAADYEFILRMGRHNAKVGHVPEYVVKYRIHDRGLTADERAQRKMKGEMARIGEEYGRPGGLAGTALRIATRAKRQFQKLALRGKIDIIPGNVKLQKYMQAKSNVASNVLDKLEAQR